MNPRLPVASGDDLIRALRKFGYEAVRQKGSHVCLRHPTDLKKPPITIPLHDEIAPGTLKRILRDAGGITVEQLIAAR
jgi:predicted RNA binding protein YcfA (HicA-like mRNA interferase family)